MSSAALLPLATLASSLVPGIIIFMLPESQSRTRIALNLAGALTKLVLVVVMLLGVSAGQAYGFRHEVLPGFDFAFKMDAIALLFVTLSTGLWLLTTLYAIGYLEQSPHRNRFFGFFSLCVTATIGISMAANLFTFFVFYELLTLATYPLVAHRGTEQARRGAAVYLGYTLVGGALLLTGIIWLRSMAGPIEFTAGGALGMLGPEHQTGLRIAFTLLIAGVGVKAALVPLHGWLPKAMVAPAPVSALLHAVAVVKAGAFGIVRIVFEVFGVEHAHALGVLTPLAVVAAITIIWGSLRAIAQDKLKPRLAYSTVSQVSYIALGVAILGPQATIGGLVHLVHQGIMKITLFFCAGNYAETLGVHRIEEMNGVGRRMPLTSVAFTLGAFGMIGLPLTAGAVSKQWLGAGAEAADMGWVTWVLTASSLLNAIYFLPLVYRAWLRPAPACWPHEDIAAKGWRETGWLLLLPPLVTGAATVGAGVLADVPMSPLTWVRLIAAREYGGAAP
ncbi:MAG: complex I subunit 5 family protein [Gammaproteobacteria bacterium]